MARAKAAVTRVPGKGHVGQGTATSMKRAMATATMVGGNEESTGDGDAIVTATGVTGVEEGNDKGSKGNGNGNGNKEGHGDQWQQHGQWKQQRGWQASNSGNNGNGDGSSTKDTASHTTTGERGMMVPWAMVCVCVFVCVERRQKIRLDLNKVNVSWSLKPE